MLQVIWAMLNMGRGGAPAKGGLPWMVGKAGVRTGRVEEWADADRELWRWSGAER